MDIRQLSYIKDLKTFGSISRLSEERFIGRTTVSASIKVLEEELGFTIINRSKKGIEFTKKGLELLEFSEKVLTLYDAFISSINDEPSTLSGQIKISATKTTETVILNALELFYQKYPLINISFQIDSNENSLARVIDGEIDFAFFIKSPYADKQLSILNRDDIEFIPLLNCETYIWCNDTHPLTLLKKVTLTDVLQFPIIFNSAQDIQLFNEMFAENKIHLVSETTSEKLIMKMVADGKGVYLNYDYPTMQEHRYSDPNIKSIKVVNAGTNTLGYVKRKATESRLYALFENILHMQIRTNASI